ncbi:DEAD/DEAH box helicase, partial [bacterium]|nr:DEAD/DEAH box helicase [bacterium]
DLIALAQTGTGKTAAYSLPILNQIDLEEKDLQSIILCPTRELCLQISQDIKSFSKHSKNIFTVAVYGGERIDFQIRALKSGAQIVVGTPGRVNDLIRRKVLKLQSIKWLVLDEADEMLDMGLKEDLNTLLAQTPESRQTLLFSATMSKSVNSIARQYMKKTHEISVGEKNIGAENVSHEYYIAQARDRFEVLKRILDYLPGVYGILFCRTKNETQIVADKLKEAHYDTEALHGDISQNIRTKIMDRFKKQQVRLLVATDVAARGIDVNNLSHVINYNLPDQNESYTHRSGRTGRAQSRGVAISIITPREVGRIKRIEKMLGRKIEVKKIPGGEEICEKQIENFLDNLESKDGRAVMDEKYFAKISDRLEKISKEDIISYFIGEKLNHFLDAYKNASDLNSKKAIGLDRQKDDANLTNLRINIGRQDGLDIKGVFGLINSSRSLKGVEVGKIDLKSQHSIFSVEKKRVDEVINHLSDEIFRGKKIEVSRGGAEKTSFSQGRTERASYSGKKRKVQKGAFRGRRRPSRRKNAR